MKRLALLVALVPSLAFAGTSYNSEKSVTHDCAKDPDVSVNVADGTFTFTGTCDKVSLNGSNLKVTIDKVNKLSVNGSTNTVDVNGVDKLSVNGSDNTVRYKSAVTGKKPKISTLGTGNKVSKVK